MNCIPPLFVIAGMLLAYLGAPRGYSQGGYEIQTSGNIFELIIGLVFVLIGGYLILVKL